MFTVSPISMTSLSRLHVKINKNLKINHAYILNKTKNIHTVYYMCISDTILKNNY